MANTITRKLWEEAERGGPGSGFFGHRGRPGKVGGSLPKNKYALKYGTKSVRSLKELSEISSGITRSIEERVKITFKIREDFLSNWVANSYNSGRSITLNYYVSKLYGGKRVDELSTEEINKALWEYERGMISKLGKNYQSLIRKAINEERAFTSYLLSRYKPKQKYIMLYRGFASNEELGGKALLRLNPLSSWTKNLRTAKFFAKGWHSGYKYHYIATAKIPKSSIFASPYLHGMAKVEKEFIVLGNKLIKASIRRIK